MHAMRSNKQIWWKWNKKWKNKHSKCLLGKYNWYEEGLFPLFIKQLNVTKCLGSTQGSLHMKKLVGSKHVVTVPLVQEVTSCHRIFRLKKLLLISWHWGLPMDRQLHSLMRFPFSWSNREITLKIPGVHFYFQVLWFCPGAFCLKLVWGLFWFVFFYL